MKDAQPVGTSPEVLQHYLTAGIDIKTPDHVGKLVGLNHGRFQSPVELDIEAIDIGGHLGGLCYYPYELCLPILKPFNQLCTPLEDGTVPACLLANLIYAGSEEPITDAEFKEVSAGFGHFNELVVTVEGAGIMCIYEDWLIDTYGNCMVPPTAYDYLRSLHFAVGLDASKFIEKTPAAAPIIQEGTSQL